MLKTIILMIIVSSLLVITQIQLKELLSTLQERTFSFQFFKSFIFNVHLWAGIFSTAISAVLWLYVLSYEKISIAYPMISFSYVLMAIVAYYYYGEKISLNMIIGIILIIGGIVFISKK